MLHTYSTVVQVYFFPIHCHEVYGRAVEGRIVNREKASPVAPSSLERQRSLRSTSLLDAEIACGETIGVATEQDPKEEAPERDNSYDLPRPARREVAQRLRHSRIRLAFVRLDCSSLEKSHHQNNRDEFSCVGGYHMCFKSSIHWSRGDL